MTNILFLPPETIYEIGLRLPGRDTRTLRLVCHQLGSVVESLALSKLYIDINADSLASMLLVQLTAFLTRSTRVVDHARTVIIYNSQKRKETRSRTNLAPPSTEEVFNTLLPPFLKLNNVQALSWLTHEGDSPMITRAIALFVTVKCIPELSFDFRGGCYSELPFQWGHTRDIEILRFKGLERLPDAVAYGMTRGFSQIISKSPRLSRLEVDPGDRHFTSQASRVLHHVLISGAISGPEQPPLSLKTLSLCNIHPIFDESIHYHIQSLESLSIHFKYTPSINNEYFRQIWDSLRTWSIHLSRVDVNLTAVDDSLLDYLLSYKGIRELIFDNRDGLLNHFKINVVANRFFRDVLPNISLSLEILHIQTIRPGAWCFGSHNASAIAQCKELKELTVSIVDLIQSRSRETLALLDETVTKLPKLHQVQKFNVATVPQIG